MVKSRAEIQKAYRQRLKEKNNEQYLTKERERRKRTYVSNSELSKGKREQRNKNNRDYLKQYRHNKKEAEALLRNAQNPVGNEIEPPSTSGYESVPSDERNRLVVRMNFPQRANGPRMRISKELKKAKTDMKALKENYENLKRKYRSTLRTMQRTKRKACSSPSTPRSKAARLVQHLKLTPEQGTRVQKELVFANAICDEISLSARKAPVKTKKILQNLVAGKVMRKYRVLSRFGAKTGMSRNTMAKVNSKSVEIEKIGRYRDVAKQKKKVIEFLLRDDNSRNMPGKADCVKSEDGLKTQKRVLTDYLSSLYQKFLSENPGIKLSFTSFCRIRPQYILLTSLITRDTCLCTRHQNMSMTLKAAKRQNIDTPVNGEKMLERKVEIVKDIENNITSETIVVGQWKRVQTEVKGQKKSVMKIVDSEMTKAEFVKHVTSQADDFDEHVTRIKTQYKEMKRLKENLPENHCIVHMDFSENYSCKSVQEIQSAYWNQTSVTLHPIVIYFKSTGSDEIFHKSIVVVSDEMGHNAGTVLTFIDKLIPEVKLINPATKCIHYWTDSPTSQYRNKVIFHSIASHNSIYGIEATWNYWEAGHGKGPCDGLGGTVKRMADGAVKTGKVAIQDPSDFYAWTQSTHCTMKKVQFIFVSTECCQEKAIEIAKLQLKPITGTMQLHAVKGKSQYIVAVRNTSCYCDVCIISAKSTCNTWRDESMELKPKLVSKVSKPSPSDKIKEDNTASLIPISSTQESDNSVPVPISSTSRKVPQIKENDYIAAVYLENWYIGKVKDIDSDDKTVEVSFLEKKKKSYQWPARPDVIWVDNSDILCKVSAPLPYGKSKRMLVLDPTDTKLVEELFNQR